MKPTVAFAILLLMCQAYAGRYAVLIGNADGGADRTPLRYVANDVAGVQAILTEFCGFPKENIAMLVNRSSQDAENALAQLRAALAKEPGDNVALVYYTGHADEENLMMGQERLPLAKFKKAFDALPVRIRIAVLDACQSGSVTRIKGGKLADPFLFREDNRIKGDVILYSSTASENSQESDIYKNSVFTFHFINALRGCGDATNDRKVTLTEAYNYSYTHTVASTAKSSGGTQHPGYQFKIYGEGDIVLADLSMRTQGIILGEDVAGSIAILDNSGGFVADFSKNQNSRFMVALAPGEYQIVVDKAGAKAQTTARIEQDAVLPLHAGNFQPVALLRTQAKGGDTTVAVDTVAPVSIPKKQPASKPHISPPPVLAEPEDYGPSVRSGISIIIGGTYNNFSALSRQLALNFSGYSIFGLAPELSLKRIHFYPAMMYEACLRNGLLFQAELGLFSSDQSKMISGRALSPADSAYHGYSLQTDHHAQVTMFCTGPGFRFMRGPLANLTLSAGILASEIYTELSSRFADSLMNVESTSSGSDFHDFALVYGAVAYGFQLNGHFDIGARVRYRYMKDAEGWLNGLDAGVTGTMHFREPLRRIVK
jgi:hypothetical protein